MSSDKTLGSTVKHAFNQYFSLQNENLDNDTSQSKYGVLTLDSSPPPQTASATTALSFR